MVELSKCFARRNTPKLTQQGRVKQKIAFAERSTQSLKHIIYRYIEDHGDKFIHKLPQFFQQGIVASLYLLGNLLEMLRTLISSQFCAINL